MMDVKVSKDKTLTDELIKRTSSMLDEINSKTVHKDEEGFHTRELKHVCEMFDILGFALSIAYHCYHQRMI